MLFRMDQLLFSLSRGLDEVEREYLGVTTNHGKRIALLAIEMARQLGWSEDRLVGTGAAALLHDSAMAEAVLASGSGVLHTLNLRAHCIKGQENVALLPLFTDIRDFVLYHHERFDKSGAFGICAEDTPLGAQIIAAANELDTEIDLRMLNGEDLDRLKAKVESKRETSSTPAVTDLLLTVLNVDLLSRLHDENLESAFWTLMPVWETDLSAAKMINLAGMIARIIDYKSEFTAKHTIQIANRAYLMARRYGMDDETCAKIYFAGSLHDVGKLMVPTSILEKRGRLTSEEYETIKSHVHWSYVLLKDVDGLADICRWATTHHRKLNGDGYPALPESYFPLDFVSRMMACIDIYQAVRETRPYHTSRSHREVMDIMYGMVEKGEIDEQIVRDLDAEMARFKDDSGDVPTPSQTDAFLKNPQ